MTHEEIKASIESISTDELIELMREQWKGIERILEYIEWYALTIETNEFQLSNGGINLGYFESEEHEEREVLSMLHLMDIAYANNVTIAGLLATSYNRWIKSNEDDRNKDLNKDYTIDIEGALHQLTLKHLWDEHNVWADIIGQTAEFNV